MRTKATDSLLEDDLKACASRKSVEEAKNAIGHDIEGLDPYLGEDDNEDWDKGVEDPSEKR